MMIYHCRQPFCNHFVEVKGSYCSDHLAEERKRKRPFEGAVRSNEGKYQDARWYKVVKIVKERDENRCRVKDCDADSDLTVHHMKLGRLSDEEFYNPDNCILLCRKCHMRIHEEIKRMKYQNAHGYSRKNK